MFLLIQPFPPQKTPPRRNRPLVEVEQEQEKTSKRKFAFQAGKVKIKTPRIKGIILFPFLAVVIGGLFVLGDQYLEQQPMKAVVVHIDSEMETPYLDEVAVQDILGIGEERPIVGFPLNQEQLAGIEKELLASPFVEAAEAYKSLIGNLQLDVKLRNPVARLINNSGEYLFVDASGHKFPVVPGSATYVPLVRGDFEESLVDTFACSTIASAIPLLNFIQQDPFWNAQIAEIVIDQSGEIRLHPQVGNQKIEFGYPVEIEEKFNNLLDFYRQVLPERGWNYYRTVTLKYRNQVVAKR